VSKRQADLIIDYRNNGRFIFAALLCITNNLPPIDWTGEVW